MLPLVLFTASATAAAGLALGSAVLWLLGATGKGLNSFLLTAFILVSVGTSISFFHLGRKERFLRAVTGITHSWLSREVLVAGLLAASTGAAYFLSYYNIYPRLFPIIITASAISGLLLVWTIGMVYNLNARPHWKDLSNAAAPLVTAQLTGICLYPLFIPGFGVRYLFMLIWCIDFILSLKRATGFKEYMNMPHRHVFPHLISFTLWGHIVRLILSLPIPALLFLSFNQTILFFIFGILLLDRFILYSGMLEMSPRTNIAALKKERIQGALN